MRTRIFGLTVITVCVLLVGCKKSGGPGANPFVGKWSVHLERTLAEGKKSPKYDKENESKMVGFITSMMGSMRLEITDDKIVYLRGEKKISHQYTVKSRDDKGVSMTVTSKVGDKEIEIVFRLIEGEYMNFKSTGSDDMDYYIWEPESAGN